MKFEKGIELVSGIELISKREAVARMIEIGLSHYMGEKLKESFQTNHETEQRMTSGSRFVRMIRREIKEKKIKDRQKLL